MSARITAVLTAFNSAHVIGRALAALPADAPIVVVDNASRDGTADAVRAARPDATLLELPSNIGFGRGCNAGLQSVRTEFACVVNPDLIVSKGLTGRCLEAMDADPALALLGLEKNGPLGVAPRDTLSGAFLMMRCAAMAPLGYFDPDFFMYFEDTDLCVRAAAAGLGVAALTGAGFSHVGAASTAPAHDNVLEKSWLWGGACALYARKHPDHPTGVQAARKLRAYAIKAPLAALTLQRAKARDLRARLSGAEALRRGGPGAMFVNRFTGN